jgi:hypothetical protein
MDEPAPLAHTRFWLIRAEGASFLKASNFDQIQKGVWDRCRNGQQRASHNGA